jgi:two-component system chemotaxis response regulator CheB
MAFHDIVVVGASAGGVEALSRLAADLPADLPAAVFVVLHLPEHATSVMPAILNRAGPLRALHPVDGAPIEPGRIYIAPPGAHMLVMAGQVALVHGAKEKGHRPAINPLFRSAALAYGSRVIGVILSGTLDDGTAGLAAVKARNGLAVVEDPQSARYRSMPQNALAQVEADRVVPLAEIGHAITEFVARPAEDSADAAIAN